MNPDSPLGFAHFLAQADGIAKFILALMLFASVCTWYLIVTKSITNFFRMRGVRGFLARFWQARDLTEIAAEVRKDTHRDAFSTLTRDALAAVDQYKHRSHDRLIDSGGLDEFLTRAIKRSIDVTNAERERGLTLLASVGSAAPFVGLFGTVWGIYHALIAIGMSGQGTLDKVAGPVGEALIMTAIGLAVAIPAVLAYNAFTRANRNASAQLDGFAHDLYGILATGRHRDQAGAGAISREAGPMVTVKSLESVNG